MAWEFIIQPCPWCEKTPLLRLPFEESSSQNTWLWEIRCVNGKCPIRPCSPYTPVRKTTKYNQEKIKAKIDALVLLWNSGNPIPAYEKTTLGEDQILRLKKDPLE